VKVSIAAHPIILIETVLIVSFCRCLCDEGHVKEAGENRPREEAKENGLRSQKWELGKRQGELVERG
jgi:hypothetical protein